MSRFSKIKGIAAISFGDIAGTAISTVFWIYLATQIEPGEYGEIHYFIGIISIISYIVTVGTRNTIIVCVSKKIEVQSTFYLISLVGTVIASFVMILIFYRLDIIFLLLGYVINVLAIGDILGKKAYSRYTKYVLVQKISTLVLGISFYFIFGYEGVLYALGISYFGFILIIYKGFKETRIDFSLLRSRISFIINNYSIQAIGGFGGQIDKIIIAPILGFTLLGNYSLALVIINMMLMFSHIVFKYLLPQDSTGEKNQKLRINTIFVSIGITIIGIIFLPTIIPEFFPKFTDVAGIIQIMSLGVVIKTITSIFESKFLGLEKSRFVLIATILHLVTMIAGMILLGLNFGIIGLAFAFVLANSVKMATCIFTNMLFVKERFQ